MKKKKERGFLLLVIEGIDITVDNGSLLFVFFLWVSAAYGACSWTVVGENGNAAV